MMNPFYSNSDIKRIENRENHSESFRTPFQRDRDRIIHSEAFRRLQNKTQVLFPGEYDFYRTRLTHTIEVAQLGRSIAHFFNTRSRTLQQNSYQIDMDLVEAICLAHDIGHPPFGHLGERILNEIMDGPKNQQSKRPYLKKFENLISDVKSDVEEFSDHGFEANAQNLRIVENLAYSMGFDGRVGFNPSFACWEGLIKYRQSADFISQEIARGEKPKIKFIYDSSYRSYSDERQFLFNQKRDVYKHYNFRSLENQIMELADDIAYSILDIEDAFKSKYIGLHNFEQVLTFIHQMTEKKAAEAPKIKNETFSDLLKNAFRGKVEMRSFKNRLITWLIENLSLEEVEPYQLLFANGDKNPRFNYEIIFPDERFLLVIEFLKEIVKEFVYTSPHIKQMQYSYPSYILELFEAYFYEPKLLPKETQSYFPEHLNREQIEKYKKNGFEIWSKSRIICDHIAGMTDHYFLKQYKKLFSVDEHPLTDIV